MYPTSAAFCAQQVESLLKVISFNDANKQKSQVQACGRPSFKCPVSSVVAMQCGQDVKQTLTCRDAEPGWKAEYHQQQEHDCELVFHQRL